MKLNICCGKRILPGYVNIDVAPNAPGEPQPDMLRPAHDLLIEGGSVDEIMCIHGWEHFYRWECDTVIAQWSYVLRRGGKLVLELPNLIKCCQNLLGIEAKHIKFKNNDQMSMWGIYGDETLENPYMIHKWGWTPETLKDFLHAKGFSTVTVHPTQFHPAGRDRRDMRLEAIR